MNEDEATTRARAAALLSGSWQCAQCGVEHGWPFDLAAFAPDPWPHGGEYRENGEVIEALDRMRGGETVDFLSEDFCILEGRHCMIRAVLMVPVAGLQEPFGFGCWSTLSPANFENYLRGFDSGDYPEPGPWTGWLVNRLADLTGPDPIGVSAQLRDARQRPLLWVMDDNHPLAQAQDDGISAERMVEVFGFYGH